MRESGFEEDGVLLLLLNRLQFAFMSLTEAVHRLRNDHRGQGTVAGFVIKPMLGSAECSVCLAATALDHGSCKMKNVPGSLTLPSLLYC